MGWLIKAGENDGVKVSPANGKEFTLDELQAYVGGLIEMVALRRDIRGTEPNWREMYVNEEGLLHNLKVNPTASILSGRTIVGDAIIVMEGEVS
tara:strand:- start:69 stop:350 length:282 start_codon:yes stop_codon:yes gene_type:complete